MVSGVEIQCVDIGTTPTPNMGITVDLIVTTWVGKYSPSKRRTNREKKKN